MAERKRQPTALLDGAAVTAREGQTKDGGSFRLVVAMKGVEVNGEPVDDQFAADVVANVIEEALTQAGARYPASGTVTSPDYRVVTEPTTGALLDLEEGTDG